MRPRRQTRQDPSVFTAKTGEGFQAGDEETASDYSTETGSTSTTAVGRTAYDLMHEGGVQHAFGKFLRNLDPLELLITIAYVTLSGWGNSPHPVWSFTYFIGFLLVYHVLLRPLTGWLFLASRNPRDSQPPR